jgi:nucleoside phosphorylase
MASNANRAQLRLIGAFNESPRIFRHGSCSRAMADAIIRGSRWRKVTMSFIRSTKSLFLIFCCLVALLYFTLPKEEKIPLPLAEGNPMSLICVFAASKSDEQRLASLLSQSDSIPTGGLRGRVGANEVALFVAGIGPRAASLRSESTLQSFGIQGNSIRRPDAVVVVGTCGSLSRTIDEGDVILYSACLSTAKTERLNCTASIAKHLKSRLNARGFLCRSALGISSPRVAISKAEKLELAKSGAEVVDMESHEVVAAASQAGLPVVVLRVVSDSLDRQIPDLNVILRQDGEIDPINLLKLGIRSPILTTTVLAASHRAVGKLRRALAIVLSDETFPKVAVELSSPSSL